MEELMKKLLLVMEVAEKVDDRGAVDLTDEYIPDVSWSIRLGEWLNPWIQEDATKWADSYLAYAAQEGWVEVTK